MESSEDEDIIMSWYFLSRRKKRRFWVHPYFVENVERRIFVAARELHDPVKFKSMYRMSPKTFLELLDLITPAIQKTDTSFRRCIAVDERLLITLRYLATGSTFSELSLYFMRGVSTISEIIGTTTKAIWDILQPIYMKIPNEDEWLAISDRFYQLWNVGNCLGALDGKHIRIQKLPNSCSSNFNYKGYHSVVLMACSDGDGCFTMIEVGFQGRNSDGGIFKMSKMGRWIKQGDMQFPAPRQLLQDINGIKFPFYFIGDEAFPLQVRLMRPFPRRNLDNKKRIYNYRLSRARKTVECTFGMMCKKFRVLSNAIVCTDRNKINNIVRSVCVLHNFIRRKEGVQYEFGELETEEPESLAIDMDNVGNDNIPEVRNPTASNLRHYLSNYFVRINPLPWQWKYCVDD